MYTARGAGQRGDSGSGKREQAGTEAIALCGTVCDLKLLNCLFRNFPFKIFEPQLTMGPGD